MKCVSDRCGRTEEAQSPVPMWVADMQRGSIKEQHIKRQMCFRSERDRPTKHRNASERLLEQTKQTDSSDPSQSQQYHLWTSAELKLIVGDNVFVWVCLLGIYRQPHIFQYILLKLSESKNLMINKQAQQQKKFYRYLVKIWCGGSS